MFIKFKILNKKSINKNMYKLSYYNFYIPVKEKEVYLIYNSYNNSLFEVPFDIGKLLEDKSRSKEINQDLFEYSFFENLIREGFVVDHKKDQREIVLDIKRKMNDNFKKNTRSISLTLLLTNNCNLGCRYCFEGSNKPNEYMKPEIFQNVLNYVSEKDVKVVYITWYGGEPLMYPHLIEEYGNQLMKICDSKNIDFESSIITNGVYLTPENVRILESVKVKRIQVTLDGNKNTHDKRRPFIHSNKSTYDIILNNLERINTNIPISIRINVDKEVYPFINDLFEDLINKKIWPHNKLISLYMGYTAGNDEYQDQNLFSSEEFSKAITEFRNLKLNLYNKWASKNNVKLATYKFKYPSIEHNFCKTLNGINYLVIDSAGNISKCWEHINDERTIVGNIKNGIENEINGIRYQNIMNQYHVPDKCTLCKVYPICESIFCLNANNENQEKRCSYWKHELENCFRNQYIMSIDHPELIENVNSAEDRINSKFFASGYSI